MFNIGDIVKDCRDRPSFVGVGEVINPYETMEVYEDLQEDGYVCIRWECHEKDYHDDIGDPNDEENPPYRDHHYTAAKYLELAKPLKTIPLDVIGLVD